MKKYATYGANDVNYVLCPLDNFNCSTIESHILKNK